MGIGELIFCIVLLISGVAMLIDALLRAGGVR